MQQAQFNRTRIINDDSMTLVAYMEDGLTRCNTCTCGSTSASSNIVNKESHTSILNQNRYLLRKGVTATKLHE
jgi:hypothetical protein